jgi:hypothetical protein
MDATRAIALTFALSLMSHASLAGADPGAEGGGAMDVEPSPPVIAVIDFDSIPAGTLPRVPGEADIPQDKTAQEKAAGIKVSKVKNPFGPKKLPKALLGKMAKTEIVEVAPAQPAISAMYVPVADATDFEGESISRMACRRKEPLSAVRWETLRVAPDGNAKLQIQDLWFDSETCSVRSGSKSEVSFKAVAWDGAKPWLFAMKDDKSVTFLMPRANDVSADAMVGPATTVRGGFTRVTLPIGRWGSSSVVATLSTLELKPPPAPPVTRTKTQGSADTQAALVPPTESNDQPVDIAVELVQTMSEKSPTLLVRRETPPDGAVASRSMIDEP